MRCILDAKEDTPYLDMGEAGAQSPFVSHELTIDPC